MSARRELLDGSAAAVVGAVRRARHALTEATRLSSPVRRSSAVAHALGELDRAVAEWEARGKRLEALEPLDVEARALAFEDAADFLDLLVQGVKLDGLDGNRRRATELAGTFRTWAELLYRDAQDERVPRVGLAALRGSLRSLVGIGVAVVGLALFGLVARLLWVALRTGWTAVP